jgi:ubiquinone/menaquinone biosynthesis C-methylase UbiE
MSEPAEARLDREREFHDSLAGGLDPASMPPRPLPELDRGAVEAAGDVRGRRVLDLGCGEGSLTLDIARRGAEVVGIDLSPGMIQVATRRMEIFMPDARAEFVAAPAEQLPFQDDSFDVVVGRFILHHLDMDRAPAEIARVLRPGGVAVFVENSGRNRLLMFARDRLAGRFGIARYGTPDEHPLDESDLAALSRAFARVEETYPVFDFFKIFDRQVLRYRWNRASAICGWLDRAVWRVAPWARRWSFRIVVRASA